jgi:hypothetical protein
LAVTEPATRVNGKETRLIDPCIRNVVWRFICFAEQRAPATISCNMATHLPILAS